jgi:hypothetical protein
VPKNAQVLRLGHYEDKAKYDPEERQYFVDLVPPEQLAPRRLAGLPRDAVLYGLRPSDGIREVRVAAVRHRLTR